MNLIARIEVKPEHRSAFEAALSGLLGPTRAETGCLRFEAMRDREAEDVFYLVETWADEAALEAHYQQPYVQRVMEHYDEWLAAPLQVTKLDTFG